MRGALVAALVVCFARSDGRADEAANAARAHELADVLALDPSADRVDTIVVLARASLDLDAILARLQHEEFQAKNAHDLIDERHEDAVERWNIAAVLVGSGVTVVGAGLELGDETLARWGNGAVIVGSTVAAAFSIVALVRRDRGRLPTAIETNLLAPLFGCSPTAASRYVDWIWRYLDTPLAGAPRSIRSELLDKWVREHRVASGEACGGRRLQLLVEPLRGPRRVDAAALDDRADMLGDVRERLAGLSVELDALWRGLQTHR